MTSARFQRVFITGAAGSGKTVAARRLGERLGLETFEMDAGAVPDDLGVEASWVVEGVFVWDVDRLLRAADVIVWLDLPARITLPRIVRRHVRLSLLRRNPHRGLRLLWRFLRWQRQYFGDAQREPLGPTDWDAITRANHAAMLHPHESKVVHLTSARAARRWLAKPSA